MQFSPNYNASGICKSARVIYIVLALFCLICMSSCQNRPITDKDAVADTSHFLPADQYQKFIDLLQAAEDSVDYNKPLAQKYLQQARQMVNDHPLSYEFARLMNSEAVYYFYLADFQKAIVVLKKSAGIFRKSKNKAETANVLSKLGLAYVYAGDYKLALNAIFEGLQLVKNDTANLHVYSRLLVNAGVAYEVIKDYDNALKFQSEYLALKRQRKDTAAIARALNNIGNIFYNQTKLDSAMFYFKESANLTQATRQYFSLTQTQSNIGNVFHDMHNPDSALVYFERCLAYYDQVGEPYGRCLVLAGLAATWLDLKDFKKATKYLKDCESCHEVVNEIEYWAYLYKIGGKLFALTGNYPMALKSYEMSHDFRDSLDKSAKDLDLIKFAVSYDFKQKAEADSLKMQLRIETSEQKSLRASNRLLIAALLLVLTGVLAILWFFRSRIMSKRSIISEQKRLLSQKMQQEMEQKLLRSQMNPHFIFNCLNTIDSFVLQNKKKEASRLIQRFSKLSPGFRVHCADGYCC